MEGKTLGMGNEDKNLIYVHIYKFRYTQSHKEKAFQHQTDNMP